jgi:carbon storage regulator
LLKARSANQEFLDFSIEAFGIATDAICQMLVLTRDPGMSIQISSAEGDSVVTLLSVRGDQATVLVHHTPVALPGTLQSRTLEMKIDATVSLSVETKVTIVDVREQKVRFGIESPKAAFVHRLEVYEAIKRENRNAERLRPPDDNLEDGLSGSAVPRPPKPTPPSLDVRKKQPEGDEG